MKDPNIETGVVHSSSKDAWNVIGKKLGGKYKIARVPYLVVNDADITERNKSEAFDHAQYISACFNFSKLICYHLPK